jgi:hypothetical protein
VTIGASTNRVAQNSYARSCTTTGNQAQTKHAILRRTPQENQTSRKPKSTRKTLRHVWKIINQSLPSARRAASLSETQQPRKAQQKKKYPPRCVPRTRTQRLRTAQPMYRLLSRGSFRSVDRTQNMPAPAPACKACQQAGTDGWRFRKQA